VYIQLDQRAAKGGIEVPFFGKPFDAFSGPVTLALRTGAALVPMYIVRQGGVRHRLVIEPEFPLERTGAKRDDTRHNLARLLAHFEGWIRARPDQWWWLSRMWKSGA
jgi:KDO2-lipid IV(A) lauroyltransferase